ncbi:NIPSNAP family protein [Devosia sp. UYZn731]|uniref:NIPSNAP family protein n=1 Tax=Devosia sp. UYZn731 TaxID=3156345 RepID=UPI0033968523
MPGSYGPFYEFRTYTIAPGGLPETAEAWSKVMDRRNEMSPVLTIMGSLEGAPLRMVHIWPYHSKEDRVKARGQASKEGIWPPPGGSHKLTSLQSELFVADIGPNTSVTAARLHQGLDPNPPPLSPVPQSDSMEGRGRARSDWPLWAFRLRFKKRWTPLKSCDLGTDTTVSGGALDIGSAPATTHAIIVDQELHYV